MGCLRFVIVVFPDHTHLLFLRKFLNLQYNSGHVQLLLSTTVMVTAAVAVCPASSVPVTMRE